MKAYSIKKGTEAKLIRAVKLVKGLGQNGKGTVLEYHDPVDFNTTRDLLFSDTVTDPARLYNAKFGSGQSDQPHLNKMAKAGYAVFASGEQNDKYVYFLCVKYDTDHIEIL